MSEALEAAARAVPDAVVERLSRARCVLALTHENPDADTLGASLGVQRLVGAFGGSVTLVSSDPVPRLYDFLPGIDEFRSDPDPDAGYDLLVASDFGTPDRMGSVRERHAALLERLPRVMIDHHVSSQSAGPADWIDSARMRPVWEEAANGSIAVSLPWVQMRHVPILRRVIERFPTVHVLEQENRVTLTAEKGGQLADLVQITQAG